MRLDHIAYRVANRLKTADFFIAALGYRVQKEFELDFGEGEEKVKCLALEPPEKHSLPASVLPWTCHNVINHDSKEYVQEYHIPPEIFISDGSSDTIVGQWVSARGGVGGIHHLAYQVDSVQRTMDEWMRKGYAEFTSEKPFQCPGLTQVFSKISSLTGVVYELIEREDFGFCETNVKNLMSSSADVDFMQKKLKNPSSHKQDFMRIDMSVS